MDTGVGTIDNVASVGGEFVEQVEAFLRGYRQLETEVKFISGKRSVKLVCVSSAKVFMNNLSSASSVT